jgi:hypothetical protein
VLVESGNPPILSAKNWESLNRAQRRDARKHGFIPGVGGGAQNAPEARQLLPFTASAHEHTEPAFTLSSAVGAATVQFNPQDVPAYGFIRHLFLEVSCTGGTGGTIAADGPWNLIQSLTLQDVNGANIVGPIDGYGLYLANLIGGYAPNQNPANAPWYVGTSPNPSFYLRVPVEISKSNGLGALANQNASANYKLSITLNTLAAGFSVAPSPVPTVTIRGWLEAWTLPAPNDSRGRPQSQVPPLLGTGQYWSQRTQSVLVGNNTVGLTRVGNYIRNLVFVARDASGVRSDAVFPDPMQFNWDGMQIHNASQRYLQQYFFEKLVGAVTRPTGVFVLPFNTGGQDDRAGNDPPDLWLPTSQSSRLEVAGNSAAAGSIQVYTNEIAPVETDQGERYQFGNASGAYAANVPPTTQAA